MSRALIILSSDADRDKACRWARGIPFGSRIEFKGSKRTPPQNDRMWAMLTELAEQLAWHGKPLTAEDWKLVMLDALRRETKEELRIVPNTDGTGFVNLSTSSSDLSKEEMTSMIEMIFAFGTKHGVIFKDPRTPDNSNSDASDPAASDPGDGSPAPPDREPGEVSPSSPGSMIDCAREFLALARIAWSDPEERDEAFKQCGIDWKAKLPENRHPEIRSVYVTTLAVPTGARNIAQARSFLSETLECNLSDLECKA